ncbi:hypothetical protein AVEN_146296-1, partial [Araneus ventricosus]
MSSSPAMMERALHLPHICTTAYGVAQISHPLAAVRLPRSVKNSEMSGNLIEMTVEENPNQCLCVKSECGCCVYLDVPEIKLNSS